MATVRLGNRQSRSGCRLVVDWFIAALRLIVHPNLQPSLVSPSCRQEVAPRINRRTFPAAAIRKLFDERMFLHGNPSLLVGFNLLRIALGWCFEAYRNVRREWSGLLSSFGKQDKNDS